MASPTTARAWACSITLSPYLFRGFVNQIANEFYFDIKLGLRVELKCVRLFLTCKFIL